MVGPPGTGKSMLAQPPRRSAAAAVARRGARVGGDPRASPAPSARRAGASACCARRTTRASAAALVGGGSPPRPGESSLAHHGVLFLDELAEFPRAALEALREPLETGRIVVSRAARQADFPAALPARRGDEPVPVRPARQRRRRHAAARPTRCCATRAGSAGRCSTASTCRSRCRRSPPAQLRPRPTASRAPSSPAACAGARERALDRQGYANARARRRGARPPLPPRRRPRRTSCRPWRRGSAGRRAAFIASCASPARSPTSKASAAITSSHLAEAIQYRRVLGAA